MGKRFLICALLCISNYLNATQIVVTNNNDTGSGSLRDAITNAYAGDTILFDSAIANATITLNSEIQVSKSLSIFGPSTSSVTVRSYPLNPKRIFNVIGGTLRLDSLIISGGFSTSDGGAIRSSGPLKLNYCEVKNSISANWGGAIFSYNSITLDHCIFESNESTFKGGAIYSNSNIWITNTTFYNNRAGFRQGGAIFCLNNAYITNSTFSQNSGLAGGAIFLSSASPNLSLDINSCTFHGNSSVAKGSAIYVSFINPGIVNLQLLNSLFARGTSTTNLLGYSISAGSSIIMNRDYCISEDSSFYNFDISGNGNYEVLDAHVLPISNYGGFTPTHMLDSLSACIDNGAPFGIPSHDQRGWIRSTNTDIGAVEYNGTDPTLCASVTLPTTDEVCSNSFYHTVSMTLKNATSFSWTTNGNGVLTHPNDSLTDYYPGAELGAYLKLSVSNAITECPTASDSILLSVTTAPQIGFLSDTAICADYSGTVALNATVTNSSSTMWSGGAGVISNPTSLSTSYQPDSSELVTGLIEISITANGNASCASVSDTIAIVVNEPLMVDMGPELELCSNEIDTIDLSQVQIINAASVLWTTEGDGYFDDPFDPNTDYHAGINDMLDNGVVITLNTTGYPGCASSFDLLDVFIDWMPSVNAGSDIISCEGDTIEFNASSDITSGVLWQMNGGGTILNNVTHEPKYVHLPAETNTTLEFYLVGIGEDACAMEEAYDTVLVTINGQIGHAIPTMLDVCADPTPVPLDSTPVWNYSSVIWSTNGDGSFTDYNSLMSSYMHGPTDLITDTVTINLDVTGLTACPSENLEIKLAMQAAPLVDLGMDQTLCSTTSEIVMVPSAQNTDSVSWVGGLGGFSPDRSTLNVSYFPDAFEQASSTTLYLHALNQYCVFPAIDTVEITFAICTGAESDATSISVSPNPTSGIITVSGVSTDETIEIYALQGQLVQIIEIENNGPVTSDISHLNNGFYLVNAGGKLIKLLKN